MLDKKRLWKKLICILLAVLIAGTSLITYSRPAFASNEFTTLLEQQFLEDFICVKSESFPLSSFKNRPEGYLKNQAVKKLASQLGTCVKANRIPRVDLNRLINVAYTSEVDEENGVVGIVAAAGKKPSTPLAMSVGHTVDGVKIEIVNFNNIDGSVVKVGTPLKLEGKARDKRGKNRDRDIVWLKNGNPIGKGKFFTYTPSESDITTLVASVNNSYTKVSFTSIPADNSLVVPPGLKPLKTQPGASVVSVDTNQPNHICFKDDPEAWKQLTTIRRGETIIHFPDIPPRKVLEVKGNCLNTRITNADEFFPRTEKPFDITKLLTENPDGSLRKLTPDDLKISFTPNQTKSPWVKLAPQDGLSEVPRSVEECNRKAYQMRYDAAKEKAVQTDYKQEGQNDDDAFANTNPRPFPIEANPNDPKQLKLPSPDEIIPPKGQFYKFDLKGKLDGEDNQEPNNIEDEKIKKRNSNNFKAEAKSDPPDTKLELGAYFGFNFQPQIQDTSKIGYDIKKPLNGFYFNLDTTTKETLLGGFTVEALKKWEYCRADRNGCKPPIKIPTGLEGVSAPRFKAVIPPGIPFWIDFPLLIKIPVEAGIRMNYENGVIGFLQTGAFDFNTSYDNRISGRKWQFDSKSESINATTFCGNANVKGNIRAALKPTVQALFWSVVGPEAGLEGWTNVEFEPPKPGVTAIVNNTGSQLQLSTAVKDAVQMKIKPSAGLDALMNVSINESLNKELTFDVKVGRVCVPLVGKPCTNISGTFDINSFLRNKFTAKQNLKSVQGSINVDIPLNRRPFKGLIGSLTKNATVLWHLDNEGAIAYSNPGKTVVIDKSSLPTGKHKIRAEMYYSPLDNALEDKGKMVSDEEDINL